MARLFIGTLKEVAFEWFMKLFASSIKKWADLEKCFLARFFEDDIEVFVLTLLQSKIKESQLKRLGKDFGVWRSDVQVACQVYTDETCHQNLQTTLLTQIGVTQSRTWKQLALQGERPEDVIARVNQEDYKSM